MLCNIYMIGFFYKFAESNKGFSFLMKTLIFVNDFSV